MADDKDVKINDLTDDKELSKEEMDSVKGGATIKGGSVGGISPGSIGGISGSGTLSADGSCSCSCPNRQSSYQASDDAA